MPRLGAELGFEPGMLWVKRDDVTALGEGGNKARKLEFLAADALAQGCRTLVTAGGPQSNHVRVTAAAAARLGLRCVAVLAGTPPDRHDGNLLLDRLLGAEVVWAGDDAVSVVETRLAETCLRLAQERAAPYEIPIGGASAVGSMGYVAAAGELSRQAPPGAVVYTAVGSGGTLAGLAVGFGHLGRVRGVDAAAVPGVDERIDELVPAVASRAHRPMPTGHLELDGTQAGPGYGARTEACREAIALVATTEGLLLDPVYSGKAMAALVADRRSGRLRSDHPVVFLHTGGVHAAHAEPYRRWLLDAG